MTDERSVRPANRILIILAVMSATLMQVLDTTIVNVALPHMQGELGATTDQISWVLTSYLVSSAIFMPLTGYFTDRMGRRRYLLLSVVGFVVSSVLCGVSLNLGEIVVFRLMQGVFGAALVPLSQAIMTDIYPVEERGKAMAIWGLGVMVGPILGPTLGGWLTEIASWRWTFYINLPVGILSTLLSWRYVPDTETRERHMDWTGLSLLAAGIAGLQYFLDRGNQRDWFAATDIRAAAVIAVLALSLFIYRSLARKVANPVFDIRILADRNFGASCTVIVAMGFALFGGMVAQPVLIESLLNYPVVTTGLVMAPRGVAMAFSMIVVGRLVARSDPRMLVGFGMLVSAAGSYAMTWYSLDVDKFWLVWPGLLQGFGMGFVFVPLSTVAYATLPRARIPEAAGLFSLMRTIGSAIGISLVSTLITRESQVAWQELGAHVNPFNPAWPDYLRSLGLAPTDSKALALAASQIAQQAGIVAIVDVFKIMAWSFVLMLPLVFLLQRSGTAPARPARGSTRDAVTR